MEDFSNLLPPQLTIRASSCSSTDIVALRVSIMVRSSSPSNDDNRAEGDAALFPSTAQFRNNRRKLMPLERKLKEQRALIQKVNDKVELKGLHRRPCSTISKKKVQLSISRFNPDHRFGRFSERFINFSRTSPPNSRRRMMKGTRLSESYEIFGVRFSGAKWSVAQARY